MQVAFKRVQLREPGAAMQPRMLLAACLALLALAGSLPGGWCCRFAHCICQPHLLVDALQAAVVAAAAQRVRGPAATKLRRHQVPVRAMCPPPTLFPAGAAAQRVTPGRKWITLVGRTGCRDSSGWLGGSFCE
jgi:hypothetical protein